MKTVVLALFATGIALHATALDFGRGPVYYATNSSFGKTVTYRIDPTDTNNWSAFKCDWSDCTIDFRQAIKAVEKHVFVAYTPPGNGGFHVTGVSVVLLGPNCWCYVIRLVDSSFGTGVRLAIEVPVLMNYHIPMMKQ